MDRRDEWLTPSSSVKLCFLHPPSLSATKGRSSWLKAKKKKKILNISLHVNKQQDSGQVWMSTVGAHPAMHLQRGKHSDVLTPEQSLSKSALPGHEPLVWYLLLWHKTSPRCLMAVMHRCYTHLPKGTYLFSAASHFYPPHCVFLVYTSLPNTPPGWNVSHKCLNPEPDEGWRESFSLPLHTLTTSRRCFQPPKFSLWTA